MRRLRRKRRLIWAALSRSSEARPVQPPPRARSAEIARSGGSDRSQRKLFQPRGHPLAIGSPRRPLLQQNEYPNENRADHGASKSACHLRAPIRAGHREPPILSEGCASVTSPARPPLPPRAPLQLPDYPVVRTARPLSSEICVNGRVARFLWVPAHTVLNSLRGDERK